MNKTSAINYHLNELEIARSSESLHFSMPKFSENDQVILDIGCGIGQTFVASNLENSKLLIGIDIDIDSLIYGRRQFGYISFINGNAEFLPFQSNSFDFIVSRVALPYTNIPKSLLEVQRVLRKDGRVWLTLHSFFMTLGQLKEAVFEFHIKDVIFKSYVIVNGVVFHLTGKQFAFPLNRKYESFQTESGITKAMKEAGFKNINISKGKHFIVTAEKGV